MRSNTDDGSEVPALADGPALTGEAGADLERITEQVATILSGILPSGVAATDGRSLTDLGLDSISAARLVLELQCAFGVTVPMMELGRCRGARDLASRVADRTSSDRISADRTSTAQAEASAPVIRPEPAARYDPFPLTRCKRHISSAGTRN